MKKNIFNIALCFISMIILSIGFVSCSNDDNLTSNYSASLLGKWQVTVDENTDAYVVTFNSDKTALIEQYKEFDVNGLTKKDGECKVTWNVDKDKILFEGGKAWFAFGYAPITLVSVTQSYIIGTQWFKDSNVHLKRL